MEAGVEEASIDVIISAMECDVQTGVPADMITSILGYKGAWVKLETLKARIPDEIDDMHKNGLIPNHVG